jgi:hypothetical protein
MPPLAVVESATAKRYRSVAMKVFAEARLFQGGRR